MQLDAAEFHAIARDKQAPAPAVVRERVEAVAQAERDLKRALAERDDLIRECRAIGIPWAALSRWYGIVPRHLHTIVHDR